MTSKTETTKPEACAEAGGQVERSVSRLQHQANEWADTATNGLQWLRNIKDGISTVDEAIVAMESDIKYCRLVAANAVLSGAGHGHNRKRATVSPRPPRTQS